MRTLEHGDLLTVLDYVLRHDVLNTGAKTIALFACITGVQGRWNWLAENSPFMRFLFIDRIVDMKPGHSITAEKTLAPEEELFIDHFPGFPVVPGVLLTEMMAQAAGKCLNAARQSRELAMLIEIRAARFRSWVKPGEIATINAAVESDTPTVARAKASVAVAERHICSSELLFAFQPRASFAAGYRDLVLEEFLSR